MSALTHPDSHATSRPGPSSATSQRGESQYARLSAERVLFTRHAPILTHISIPMNHLNKSLLISLTLLAFAPLNAASASPTPQGDPDNWLVANNGNDQLVENVSAAVTYRIRNNGADQDVWAIARRSDGQIVGKIKIEENTSGDIGVPAGGDLEVDDRDWEFTPNGDDTYTGTPTNARFGISCG